MEESKKKNMKKERKFGLKEFPRPLCGENGGKFNTLKSGFVKLNV